MTLFAYPGMVNSRTLETGVGRRILALCLGLSLSIQASMLLAAPLHHDLMVKITPADQYLAVEDTITLPSTLTTRGRITLVFSLHPELSPRSPTPGVTLARLPEERADESAGTNPARYAITVPDGLHDVVLVYEGRIHHPILLQEGDQARGVGETAGIISNDGVFLSAASAWYPRFDQERLSFSLDLQLPAGWDAVSQGERTLHERDDAGTRLRWEEPNPQTDIYLVADRYHEYTRQFGPVLAIAFLRTPDNALAQRYLEATGRYLSMFSALFGPYLYGKFALVENFWETGYGMPSFTLLGSSVIRLPFILHSSYPHEILHNWWGNGVYVDYAHGNWAEGLTAYLADHLLQEQRGAGAAMRRNQLQRYADYVDAARDIPLIDFRSRHSPASEAIGYGKAMMFFHMLRRQLGDEAFLAGLRDFYAAYPFQVADYEDMRRAFAAHADSELRTEFHQWTIRSGAPRLTGSDAGTRRLENGAHELIFKLEQTQPGPVYQLNVPLAITLDGEKQAFETDILFGERSAEIRLTLPARPLRVEIDPQFDLFRRVDRLEIPPTLSQVFGAERLTFVLPANAPNVVREAYRALALAWRGTRGDDDFIIVNDREIDSLPEDRSVWLLGWDNRFIGDLATLLTTQRADLASDGVNLPERSMQRDRHNVVLVGRRAGNPDLALAWLGADDPRAIMQLARRLPHYGRFSYLGFGGDANENLLQGQWPITDSPLALDVHETDGQVGGISRIDSSIGYAPRKALAYPVDH